MVARLTARLRRARIPNVRFTILSRTSVEILPMIENLEIDAGITYLDNEPLGRVTHRAALRASATAWSARAARRRSPTGHEVALGGGRPGCRCAC